MERLTHEADFGLEDWEETLFFVESDPNGAYNIIDIAKWQGEPEFDEILKNISLRLAAIENILGDEYDLDRLRELAQADREGRCVVPVVRCRDCKHGKRGVDNMVRCSHPCGKVISMTAENFCSYGQRKIETVLPINDTKDENLVMI